MNPERLLRAILPDVLIDNFDIVNFDKSADRFDIYLDEKKEGASCITTHLHSLFKETQNILFQYFTFFIDYKNRLIFLSCDILRISLIYAFSTSK